MFDFPWRKILLCKKCGKECYVIELDDDSNRVDWWKDKFRLWRGCALDSEDDGYEKDDHRTMWTDSMKSAVKDWNAMNEVF